MKKFDYQQDAIKDLVRHTVKLLNEGGRRRKIVFDAPTGSGKTVMACQALADIVEALRTDASNRYEDVAFIWFAPRKLHLQSYMKLKGAFDDDRQLRPVMFDELQQSEGIQPGEILFVNWESVNKDSNRMANDSESSASIFEIARITRERQGLPIVAIIDEEHMFWSKTADKTAAVLDRINPDVEIRISATPKTMLFDEKVRVGRDAVIKAGMIKKEVVLNPEIDVDISDDRTLTEHLLKTALAKREQLAEAYQKLGIDINPLLLVQLPNDTKETMTSEEQAIAEHVEQYLKVMCDISADNGKLAVWLSNRKDNLEGLERDTDLVEVLLFKEAIALGWDCPRAAVLLIFRKLSSNEFTVQTVGRILRMPQQMHYTDGKLNIGYVYTDIAQDKIRIIADQDYLRKNVYFATRRDDLVNVSLQSTYATRPNDTRNYLGPDFRGFLMRESEKFWSLEQAKAGLFSLAELAAMQGDDDAPAPLPETDDMQVNENRRRVQNTLRLDVKTINIPIPKDVHFQNDEQEINIADQKAKFTRTAGEIDRVFINFVSKYVAGFENKNRPADKLASYLLEVMAEYFGIFDTDAKKVILYHENAPYFDRLIRQALDRYLKERAKKKAAAKDRIFATVQWEVPDERVYDQDTHKVREELHNHALLPFVELNTASTPEKRFAAFLEKNSQYIDWWYKNGDKGREHYAVPYETADGSTAPFYVDFVIRLKNGKIFLFDTKSPGSEPLGAPYKHNGFLRYAAEQRAKGIELQGGVIVEVGENWLYSKFEISTTSEHDGWVSFIPKDLSV